jgi:hypothetical protein
MDDETACSVEIPPFAYSAKGGKKEQVHNLTGENSTVQLQRMHTFSLLQPAYLFYCSGISYTWLKKVEF